jgi:hypothetical protein
MGLKSREYSFYPLFTSIIILFLFESMIYYVSASPDLEVGDSVKVKVPGLRVRIGPGLDKAIIGIAGRGTKGIITGGPKEADGYKWWKIEYQSGIVGWSAERLGDRVYLEGTEPLEKISCNEVGGECEFWPCSKGGNY